MNVAARLAELGLRLPPTTAPVAAYLPVVEAGGIAWVSGQLPFRGPDLMTGRVGQDVGMDFAREAARNCALMVLSQLEKALGSLERVERIVKLGVFVNSDARFTEQHLVANGASELMQALFGEAGRHARAAVGVPCLPLNAAVEVDAVVAVRPA